MTEFDSRPIALVIPSLAGGGAERMWLNLAGALLRRGHAVDLVVLSVRGELGSVVPMGVSVFGSNRWPLGSRARLGSRTQFPYHGLKVGYIRPLVTWRRYRERWPTEARQHWSLKLARDADIVRAYVRKRNPRVLLTALTRANRAAILARELDHRFDIMVTVTVRNNVRRGYSAADKELARVLYPLADAIVGVSRGVAEDATQQLCLPKDRVHHIYNGVSIHRIEELCVAKSQLTDGQYPFDVPVVLSVARLVRGVRAAKDHDTLLRAFARARGNIPAKLVFIGSDQEQGSARNEFLALAAELGVADDVVFWGFDDNPYPYIRAASVLVMSSRWEGLPGVLIEAMACGTPVVSTDAPFGPAEILDGGQFGHLVPVGDAVQMGRAIEEVLSGKCLSSAALRERAAKFSVESMADRYERLVTARS